MSLIYCLLSIYLVIIEWLITILLINCWHRLIDTVVIDWYNNYYYRLPSIYILLINQLITILLIVCWHRLIDWLLFYQSIADVDWLILVGKNRGLMCAMVVNYSIYFFKPLHVRNNHKLSKFLKSKIQKHIVILYYVISAI